MDTLDSTYPIYWLVLENISAGTEADDLLIQYRYGGTTQTTGYYGQCFSVTSGGTSNFTTKSNDPATALAKTTGVAGYGVCGNVYFYNFGVSNGRARHHGLTMSPSLGEYGWTNGQQDTQRTWDGFLIKAETSNITGAFSLYGVKTS